MENITKLVDEWLLLYPSIVMNGENLRTPAKYCIKKMEKFCADHPQYTKDIIFAATKMYINERAKEDYKYTKRAHFFISKLGQPSALEQYCKQIVDNKNTDLIDDCPEFYPIDEFI